MQKRNPLDFVPNHFYCNSVFPNKNKQLEILSRKQDMRLKTVKFKFASNRSSLTGIQFVYSNGIESPLFQTKEAADDNEVFLVDIDTNRTIRKVSLKLDGQKIGGMRFFDIYDSYIMNVTWNNQNGRRSGKWITRTFQPGLEIIGLQCNTNYLRIQQLGFLLWRPRPRAMEANYECGSPKTRHKLEIMESNDDE